MRCHVVFFRNFLERILWILFLQKVVSYFSRRNMIFCSIFCRNLAELLLPYSVAIFVSFQWWVEIWVVYMLMHTNGIYTSYSFRLDALMAWGVMAMNAASLSFLFVCSCYLDKMVVFSQCILWSASHACCANLDFSVFPIYNRPHSSFSRRYSTCHLNKDCETQYTYIFFVS